MSAAVAAQRALAAGDWSAFGSDLPFVRVRMGLHTGAAEHRAGDDELDDAKPGRWVCTAAAGIIEHHRRVKAGGDTVSIPEPITKAYEEVVDFLAQGPSSGRLIAFRPSREARDRVADLIVREKTTGLSDEETAELDHYLQLEHLMRLAQARARQYVADA